MARTQQESELSQLRGGVLPAVDVFVQDQEGRVLMRRSDDGMWTLPGGVIGAGEFVGAGAERHTLEGTGVPVKAVDVIGVYSDPEDTIEYGGEVGRQVALCLRGLPLEEPTQARSDSGDVVWFGPVELDEVAMQPATRLRVHHGLERLPHAHIG